MKLVFLFLVLLLLPVVGAQTVDRNYTFTGSCQNYLVNLPLPEPGCYDVKIDLTTNQGRVGEIFDPREGWKSTFFYVKEQCANTSLTFQLRANTKDRFFVKTTVKSPAAEWTYPFQEIEQYCPAGASEDLSLPQFLFVVLVVILALVVAMAKYVEVIR